MTRKEFCNLPCVRHFLAEQRIFDPVNEAVERRQYEQLPSGNAAI